MRNSLKKIFNYMNSRPVIWKIFIVSFLVMGILAGGLLAYYVDYYYSIFSLVSGIGIICVFWDKKNLKLYKKINSRKDKAAKNIKSSTTWEVDSKSKKDDLSKS